MPKLLFGAAVSDYTEGLIKCGLDIDEFRKAAAVELTGTEVEDGQIEGNLADILAEELWEATLRRMPEVIAYGPER